MAGGLDLLAIFREEVDAQLAQARALLLGWDQAGGTTAADEDLCRVFHTLKGAARALGCDPIRELAGALEDLLREPRDGADLPADLPGAIGCGLRWIESVLDAVVAGTEPPPVTGFLEQLARLHEVGDRFPCAPPTGIAWSAAPGSGSAGGEQRGATLMPPAQSRTAPPTPAPAPAAPLPHWGPAMRSDAASGEPPAAAPQRARLAYSSSTGCIGCRVS